MYSRYIPPSKSGQAVSATHQDAEPSTSPAPVAVLPQVKPPGAYRRYIPPLKHDSRPIVQTAIDGEPAKRIKLATDTREPEPAGPGPRSGQLSDDPGTTRLGSGKKKASRKAASASADRQKELAVDVTLSDAARLRPVNDLEEPILEEKAATTPFPTTKKDERALAKKRKHDEPEGQLSDLAGPYDGPNDDDEIADSTTKKRKKKRKETNGEQQQQDVASDDDEIRRRHKSIFEKKAKSLKAPAEVSGAVVSTESGDIPMLDAPDVTEARGLEPLPQPEPVAPDESEPTFESLPTWLAEPIRVSREATASFTSLGLSPELGLAQDVVSRLAAKGYEKAFAIQTAVIPQLLPHHCRSMQSDILVSASTGSGKTLAYAIPMIRDLSLGNRHLTQLRALVVLPTRELVRQAQIVCEECAGVFALDGQRRRVKIGIAMGSQTLQREQSILIEREQHYNPEAWRKRQERFASHDWVDPDLDDTEDEERIEILKREDRISTLPDHVLNYRSKVDVLICTPGRLVEHIKYTPGFNLEFARWLVVDEADKLLGQNFQHWLDVVMPRLHNVDGSSMRNHKQTNLSGVRKVILSATMTRDLDLLEGLKLRRPKLIVLEGSGRDQIPHAEAMAADHSLPELLRETALKADAHLKPLFLLDLLQSPNLLGNYEGLNNTSEETSLSDSSSSEDSDSDTDTDTDTDSSTDSDSASDLNTGPESKAVRSGKKSESAMPRILIFTKSNETAMRLSRLVAILSSELEPLIGTLTSTAAYSDRKQTLRAFSSGKIRIIVASDLIARGIDLPNLEHVINYDMPTSISSYIHRVGRTARAGKHGHAWTLFTDAEARWFWKEVANERVVKRSREVERIRITEEKEAAFEDKKARFEVALEVLSKEATARRRH